MMREKFDLEVMVLQLTAQKLELECLGLRRQLDVDVVENVVFEKVITTAMQSPNRVTEV